MRMPVAQVIQVCTFMMASKPRMPALAARPTVSRNPRIWAPTWLCQPRAWSTVAEARVAETHRTVSQPTVRIHDSAADSRLPLYPKAARDRARVGALPRLPRTAMTPHRKNDRRTPTLPATTACQKDRPNPRTQAPQDSPRTEMLAANQGMNRSLGRPLRSDSAMMSRPAFSTWAAEEVSADVLLMGNRPRCRNRGAFERR